MKIAVLLKSGPGSENAERAFQTVSDMLQQGHRVSLFLIQEAVRFCCGDIRSDRPMTFKKLMDKDLEVHALNDDAELRGIDVTSTNQSVLEGSYDSLISLIESCDRVVGIL